MADASAGIPQPAEAPPWAVKPVPPDTCTTRVVLATSGPAVAARVSRMRHGVIGTKPRGEITPAGRIPCVAAGADPPRNDGRAPMAPAAATPAGGGGPPTGK